MGCGSAANLLLPVGGTGDRWMEGGAVDSGVVEQWSGRVAEHDDVVTGFLVIIIVWGWVVLNHLHWLSRMEASCFHSAQAPGIRHNQQMFSLRQELSACLKWWTNPTSPNLDIGPWISNCWMSSLTELVPCLRLESFCH